MALLGWLFGVTGMIFGLIAFARVSALEKKLKGSGVLNADFDSVQEIE